ncbi:MAG: phage repressor protein/antirepressor Ant [Oscillospiraceae bacterium]|jgi:prophage antirepressor-like protein|nr:phage repressor protein/antirepressor Ant [Oscillospiraceae bacterium]
MNDIMTFNNPEFGEIRTTQINGEPWFVAVDVCRALDLSDTSKTLERLDDDEKGTSSIRTPGGKQKVSIINEPGLYSLVMGSRKPEAKAFKRWTTHEVIPSIRKHGAYMTPETLEAAILNPDTMIKLCTALKEEQDKRKALEAVNSALAVNLEIARPKAEYFDQLVDRNLLTNIRETAKQLQVKEREFVKFLLEKKYLFRDKRGKLLPYAEKNDGLFEVKECINEKTQWSGTQTLVTPKGRETFRLLCISVA